MAGKPVKESKDSAKKQRLAQALRENLKRRKAQSRQRNSDQPDPEEGADRDNQVK